MCLARISRRGGPRGHNRGKRMELAWLRALLPARRRDGQLDQLPHGVVRYPERRISVIGPARRGGRSMATECDLPHHSDTRRLDRSVVYALGLELRMARAAGGELR